LDIIENIVAIIVAIISMAGLGYFLGLTYQKRIHNLKDTEAKKEDNNVIRQRLMNVRNHTMRLKELYSLRKRVADFDKESEAIDKSIYRIEIILDQLHRIIEEGDELLAETILTRFSKHLRQLLHECASTEIEVSVNVEHVDSILALLCSLNYNKWSYEINTDALADIDFGRSIKSMTTSPWIFEILWDSVLIVGVENVVKLEISSDTYSVKYNLKTNGSIHSHESKLL
jgi:hypothetical protein